MVVPDLDWCEGEIAPRGGAGEEAMAARDEHPIVVTRPDLERLRTLIETVRARRRWEEMHLLALADELESAEVVEPERVPPDVVTMRSRVRVLDMVSGQATTYTICYPSEANVDAGRLSVLAPIGTALLGYREGDVVEWPVPGGVRVLKIEKLEHQPESAARPRKVVES
jgi:regulator of nucleoside diphosphate kinase